MRTFRLTFSGLHALYFMLGESIPFPSDTIRFYCPFGTLNNVIQELIQVHGFMTIEVLDTIAPLNACLRFTKANAAIIVGECRYPTSWHFLPFGFSTAVFNLVSADTFFCAYPELTLQHRGVLSETVLADGPPFALGAPTVSGNRCLIVVNKVSSFIDIRTSASAWARETDADSACDHGVSCPVRWRYLGDRHCIKSSFDANPEDGCAGFAEGIWSVLWRLGGYESVPAGNYRVPFDLKCLPNFHLEIGN